ncbi:uncharacterized protein K02A2.6 [Trichonephila clavipes]|uniref:Uncharacterized protein K02A2.6 n=1 Tax=Trichonephila clavipes TaxID=2585209 RepID=A0A8X6UUU0_TRICX|nr:uncharacterized protein K02A2.6 [Trichonephila clavipes]
MKVCPDSQKLMSINTHKGLYVCKRLMYGLNGAPAVWQRYVDGLFQGMDGVKMSQIEALPVTSKELRKETGKDIELGPLLKALREGKDLQGREAQYTIEDGCIMYGQRFVFQGNFERMF